MKQSTLKAQALKRWETLSALEQKRLREELASYAQGTACIELDEISYWTDTGRTVSRGRIVKIGFGKDVSQREKRYLFLSDIPKE